jgi:hypothetical protein
MPKATPPPRIYIHVPVPPPIANNEGNSRRHASFSSGQQLARARADTPIRRCYSASGKQLIGPSRVSTPVSLCSFGLSASSQQYFSLRTNQSPATSQQYFLSEQISNSHQPPAKRTGRGCSSSAHAAIPVGQQFVRSVSALPSGQQLTGLVPMLPSGDCISSNPRCHSIGAAARRTRTAAPGWAAELAYRVQQLASPRALSLPMGATTLPSPHAIIPLATITMDLRYICGLWGIRYDIGKISF